MARIKPTSLAAAALAAQAVEQEVLPPESVAETVADAAEPAPVIEQGDAPEQGDDTQAGGAGEESEAAEDLEEPIFLHNAVIAMAHPDGGSCDRYETDEAGNILVPAAEVGDMMEHGFAPVEN